MAMSEAEDTKIMWRYRLFCCSVLHL